MIHGDEGYDAFENLSVAFGEQGVATLRLGSSDGVGKVTRKFHEELEIVFQALARDSRVKVIIITGAGRHFSAGGDLNWMEEEFSFLTDRSMTDPALSNFRRALGPQDCQFRKFWP